MQYEPSKRERMQVQELAAYGFNAREIARVMGHRVETIREHFESELELGGLLATAKVAATLFRAATRRSKPSIGAAIYWLKTRGGWRSAGSSVAYLGSKESARLLAAPTVEESDGWGELLAPAEQKPIAERLAETPKRRRVPSSPEKHRAGPIEPARSSPNGSDDT